MLIVNRRVSNYEIRDRDEGNKSHDPAQRIDQVHEFAVLSGLVRPDVHEQSARSGNGSGAKEYPKGRGRRSTDVPRSVERSTQYPRAQIINGPEYSPSSETLHRKHRAREEY
jgi:hypothetical protein